MGIKRAAGLIYGPEYHHLDHLSTICLLMQIPLIVTEEELAVLARKYYPKLEVISYSYLIVAQKLVQDYEVIFYCMPRDLFDEAFFLSQKLLQKRIHTIWCPHGNSDKGHASYFMEGLKKERIALVYGQKMIDFLKQKHAYEQLQACVIIDNYRYTFYQREKEFYDKIVEREILNLTVSEQKPSKIILFAPTWQDSENSSSFFDACPLLADQLPEEDYLIVKIHPNLLLQESVKVDRLVWKYEDRPHILFLTDFPPIYPLLNIVDIYIGDMSSIGYDFLLFDRPMFFLNQNNRDSATDLGLYLYRCGVEIKPDQYKNIYKIIEDHLHDDFSEVRKEVYTYTFGKEKSWDELREAILKTYDTFEDDELNFF